MPPAIRRARRGSNGRHPVADPDRVVLTLALIAHHRQDSLGRGRVLARQLVGDVAVVPVELVRIARVPGQGERGVEVDLRQLLGEGARAWPAKAAAGNSLATFSPSRSTLVALTISPSSSNWSATRPRQVSC